MSLRTRKPSAADNNENHQGKSINPVPPSKATVNFRRPALVDLGNNLPTQQGNAVAKKPTDARGGIQAKKPNDSISIRKTTVVQKEKEKNPSIITKNIANACKVVPKQQPVKREESVLLKHVAKVEKNTEAYSTTQLRRVLDVDTSDDPLHVSEYVQDIHRYLQELESEYCVEEHFLDLHKSTPKMRCVLVNWMAEVNTSFKFLLETFHLSIGILDRYLQVDKSIGSGSLQLVGTAAMLIAGKYEEIYVPDIADFVYICDDSFSKQQIFEMERDILSKLNFNLGRPLSIHFLRRYNKVAKARPEHHVLAKYLLELALMEYDMSHLKPSIQAAAACCLSASILEGMSDPLHAWTKVLAHHSRYSYSDIKVAVVKLACALGRAETSKHQAIRSKYAAASYGKISLSSKLKCNLIRKLIANSPVLNKK